MFQARKLCVLCKDSPLIQFIEFPNFPINCIDNGTHSDFNWTMRLGRCESCGSVQHMNLLDPSILYSGKYPLDNTHSAIWNHHHDEFSRFIRSNLSRFESLLEIGASSQVLVDRLHSTFSNYTVFDFSLENAVRRDGVQYLSGNCETYPFQHDSVIIMSHVFEHLYDPNLFLQNCSKNSVHKLFISIPSMENQEAVHVTREHTFGYNNQDILYLFSKYKYKAIATEESGFSIFYFFTLDSSVETLPRTVNPSRYLRTQEYFTKTFSVPEQSFLIGAGFWSQLLYHNIQEKEHVIGVLDNDRMKQGHTFLNTTLTIEPFSALSNYGSGTHVLILEKKLWTDEVVSLIQKINPLISIVYLS